MQAQIAAKLKSLSTQNPVKSLKQFLAVRPVGCKTKSTIAQDLQGFQFVVSKIPEKEYDNVVKQLTQKQCELVLDYLHRFMQHVTETENNIATGQQLALYERIVAAHGPTIIINAISRPDTLVNRIPEF